MFDEDTKVWNCGIHKYEIEDDGKRVTIYKLWKGERSLEYSGQKDNPDTLRIIERYKTFNHKFVEEEEDSQKSVLDILIEEDGEID